VHGKREEEIPVFGRVVAIADVYDALSCRRVFRDAISEADVLRMLRRGAGKGYDPEKVEAFSSRLNTIRAIGKRFPD
jgi:response regulator RpfG family c-di-GMP phosphodiesterase